MKNFSANQTTINNTISIRLKVTEKCPWSCVFCHKEGGWQIDDVQWNSNTANAFMRLKEMTGATEIHYTGGEPTSLKTLNKLNAGFTSLGFKVKTTTNGQFSEDKLNTLLHSGLKHYNFSVLSFDPEVFVHTQARMSLTRAASSLQRQRSIICKAALLGASVKINTVISDERDFPRALDVYSFAKDNGIGIRFLNDLNNGVVAKEAVDYISQHIIKAEKSRQKCVLGSSSTTDFYIDRDGFEFGVKGIRKNHIPSLCSGCKEVCREGFYGIRLEQKKGVFFVRLCIHRQDEKSVMPLDIFLQSEQLKELNQLTGFRPYNESKAA